MKKPSSRKSESSIQVGSPQSPFLQSPSPSDGGAQSVASVYHSPENHDNPNAIVVDRFTRNSPEKSSSSLPVPEQQPPPQNALSVTVFNAYSTSRQEPPPSVTNPGPGSGGGRAREDGGDRRGRTRPAASSSSWSKRDEMVRKAALGFRFSELVLCLISFSVMAADKTQGWSGDSFDRYKEYRYCLCVNVIAFAYSGFQACDLACQLVTRKPIIYHHLRYHFDFFMDQVLAYLLISASSSAATRVDDWQSNWGKDEFTEMATASVGLAFLAFLAFAISSLISGYILCSRNSS